MPAHRIADGKNAPFAMGYHVRADIPFSVRFGRGVHDLRCLPLLGDGPHVAKPHVLDDRNIDAEGQNGGPMISNKWPPAASPDDYAERLEQAGISWKVYQQKDNYGCNMLENFKAFREARPDSPLYKKGLVRGAPDQFEQDALNDGCRKFPGSSRAA